MTTPGQRDPDLARLARIMATLRAPDGCPWDREQSLETLRHYLLEEAHEVLEVMTSADAAAHCEELGDLMLQIAFQAQIRAEEGAFELADVVDAICDKMVRRHPHVFGDEDASDASAVKRRWEEIKQAEGKKSGLAAVSESLPALMRAEKLSSKAAKLGFDWRDVTGPIAKVREELAEVEAELAQPERDEARIHAEVGDLLLAVVNVARHLEVRPELAMHDAASRMTRRVAAVQAHLAGLGRAIEDATEAELDAAWEAVKRVERT